uniref:Cytochrome c oxidase subunit 3 n=1 Tax=Sindiplozoon sp. DZ-2018 TaxID=2340795 RepID=A0A386PY35_9PLAT|nr:cytochrome c oxidase subunit 3 [Sindiplozoon sp. DZ-2018]
MRLSFFSIFVSLLLCLVILFIGCLCKLWLLQLWVCFFIGLLVFLATKDSGSWCDMLYHKSKKWIRWFILGEFIFFLSLMVPAFYLKGDLSENPLSSAFGIPLLNLFLLVLSSFCMSQFEHVIGYVDSMFSYSFSISETWKLYVDEMIIYLGSALFLSWVFLCLQAWEFNTCPASVSDSAWYSCCLVLVSFHGLHVVIGQALMVHCYFQIVHNKLTVSLEMWEYRSRFVLFCCYYWHFVDVVWFFVYFFVSFCV